MDDEVWISPEKEKVMNELMPYLEENTNVVTSEFNSCISVLN